MLGQVVPLAAPLSGRTSPESSRQESGTHTAEGNKEARMALASSRGACRPLGATPIGRGVNFAVVSRHAQSVQLVLFEEGKDEVYAEFLLDPARNRTGDVWHIFLEGLPPGIVYGYRVNGPYSPRSGHR